jgi:outer membrane receptor protein involved in Fe transport
LVRQWGATAGAILNDARGGWFSVDGEYGSGLSSNACAPSVPGFCSYTPHIVFDVEKGIALGRNVALTVRVGNLLNDRYFVTFENAQGNHYAQSRTVALGVRFSSP